ncbi:DNA replication regulator SLD2 [Candida viswanathii]|uniref:DNA replication regulator SLD2 n=1 Tax=Candida viswanathii TaxID=5486 RepID=A0A367Y1K5_9ASCO|nr:DNA replication regulator SLD2 [Candida viswanathii]
MEVAEVKQKIKEWEYAFREKNNRLPSKSDIKENSEIRKLYSLYRAIKLGKPPKEAPKKEPVSESPVRKNVFDSAGELGPTPQANGRVLSIFDFKMTPPESSPLKKKSTNTNLPSSPQKMDMPPPDSPVKRIMVETPTKNRVRLLATPTKSRSIDFSAFSPGYRKENPQTPTSGSSVAVVDFQVSPSPMKPLRGIGKKLADLYKSAIEEAETLKDSEFADGELVDEVIEEEGQSGDEEDETETTTVYKRKRTQKRLTKRVKMAPRPVEEKPTLDNINIQKKVSKMEEKEREHIEAYINSEDEEEEDEVKPRVPESPVKKTRKPTANNFQRLKINDPRAKRFKQRMRRR